MPYDPQLAARMREALRTRKNIQERKMFGGPCWMLNGNMLCAVEVGRYMFRVGKEQQTKALQAPGAAPMDITGKPMPGFVWVQSDHTSGKVLTEWINLAEAYVGTLRPKRAAAIAKKSRR